MAVGTPIELQLALNTVEGAEVMRALDLEPLTFSEIAERTGLDVVTLALTMRTLASFDVLRRRDDARYVRADTSADQLLAR